MTVGTDGFKGLAVPLFGDFEIKQRTLGTDIMTITGIASQTGDYIVCRNSDETEKFVVDVNGLASAAGGVSIPVDKFLEWPSAVETAPTTGLTEGDMFVSFGSSTPQIGICYSTAANSLRYITADTKTFGRTTA